MMSVSVMQSGPSTKSPLLPEAWGAKRDMYLRLRSINGVKSLVQKQADGPAVVDPRGAILVERGVVPQHGEEVCDNEGESGKGDEVGRHAHGKAFDDDVCVERLQHVLGQQRIVHARVLVLLERGELALPYVDHLGCIVLYLSRSSFLRLRDSCMGETVGR